MTQRICSCRVQILWGIMQKVRRISFLWFILAVAAQILPAQNFTTDNSSKVVIVESRWYEYSPEPAYFCHFPLDDYVSRPYFYNSRNETLDCYSLGLSNTFAVTREREKQFVYQARVRNAGEKQIVALDWDYIFIDPETEKVIERHSFRTQQRIRPRKSKTLSEVSVSPPTHVVNVQALEKNLEHQFTERIVVNSIIFLDGSVWTRSAQND